VTGGPPTDAVVLVVTGLRGPADLQRVLAAIMGADPAAMTWVDGPRGLVAVRSGLRARALRDAAARAGFGVRVQGGRPGVGGVLLRTLLFAVGGIAVGLALGVLLGLGNSMFNPDCTRPGSSGNCAIGVGLFGGLGALLGGPIGLVAGLVSGLARRG